MRRERVYTSIYSPSPPTLGISQVIPFTTMPLGFYFNSKRFLLSVGPTMEISMGYFCGSHKYIF